MPDTQTSIDLEKVYRHVTDVVCRKVGPESILVPIRHNVGDLDYIYTLSPVATFIWNLLDGTRSLVQIVEAVCNEYDVPNDQAATDVAELVSDLSKVSLVLQVN
ncbi:MAG TPA: PqqD family protein [Thermoanaerobaculia bacterium]|nr:PqqD family protein [Thermoanaerobaculia bacterium]